MTKKFKAKQGLRSVIFGELYKNNKHTCNQSIFDALGRAL